MSDIFENQKEVVDNIYDSAKELGTDLGKKPEARPQKAKPKRNCKLCYGRGYVKMSFPGNDGNPDSYNTYCSCVKLT